MICASTHLPLALAASTMDVHGDTVTRPRMPGATGRRRPQRTLHRSVSGPPFAALPNHFALYGKTSYHLHYGSPA